MTFPSFRCTAYNNEFRKWRDSGVQATLSDKRRSVCNEELGIAYFEAEVLTQTDYYPFGATMPDRQWSAGAEGYRYGFNGMERDDETYGKGNALDFGARIYDPRISRFLSIDPKTRDFPYWSTYLFAANNPIYYIDYLGESPEKPITYSAIKAAFNDGKIASSYGLVLYVDQPKPGKSDPHDGADVGHTFIKLIKFNNDGTRTEQIFGFYPKGDFVLPYFNERSQGVSGNDDGHEFNVKVTKTGLSQEDFNNVLDLVKTYEEKSYDLDKCNCTDFGLEAAGIVGISLPDTQGTWPGGGGSNPGNTGKDIIDNKIELEKDKNVKVDIGKAKAKDNSNTKPKK